MYRRYREQGVVFIGLTPEGSASLPAIRGFVEQTGVPWPNGYGARSTLRAFGNTYTPQTWVVGRDGRIAWNEAAGGTLEDGIQKALNAGGDRQAALVRSKP